MYSIRKFSYLQPFFRDKSLANQFDSIHGNVNFELLIIFNIFQCFHDVDDDVNIRPSHSSG